MGIGFEVTDDSGRRQVLDTAPLITFKDKYTKSNTNRYVSFDYIFAYKPANGHRLYGNPEDRSGKSHKLIGEGEIYRFNDGVAPERSNFGLEVFSDTGVLQFSSNQKPLKIIDVVYENYAGASHTWVNGNKVFWSKDYGNKDIAVIVLGTPATRDGKKVFQGAPAIRGNVLSIEEQQLDERFGTWQNSNRLYLLVIDVAGF